MSPERRTHTDGLDDAASAVKDREPIPGSIGFVFSGQGLTKRADLFTLFDDYATINADGLAANVQLLENASGLPLSQIIAEKNEDALGRTDVLQALIHASHLSAIDALGPYLSDEKQTRITAGHSGGEIAAMVAAGILTKEDSARVIAERGRIMHEHAVQTDTGLVITLGFDRAKTEHVLEETGQVMQLYRLYSFEQLDEQQRSIVESVAVTRQISPDKLWEMLQESHPVFLALANDATINVVGGSKLGLDVFGEVAKINGARRMQTVPTETTFHTPDMQPVADIFAPIFRSVQLNKARFPVALNDGSKTTNANDMRESHLDRITSSVEWVITIGHFAEMEAVVAIGPGGKVPGVSKTNGIPDDRQQALLKFLANQQRQ